MEIRKILTISPNDQGISWGPAIHYLELWNALRQARPAWEIEGLAPDWTGKEPILTPVFALRRLKVADLPLLRSVFFDLRAALAILFGRASLVYLRTSHFHLFTLAALLLRRLPLVIELNGINSSDSRSAGKGWLYRKISHFQERSLFRRCQAAIAVSHSIENHARAAGVRLCVTIANGVAPRYFANPPRQIPSRPRIIYVGTFTPWDGAAEVITLARDFPEVDFLMVGDGSRRTGLAATAPANVEFLGSRPYGELPVIYAGADAGIVLYELERHRSVEVSSLKTLEYVACGLPIFSSAIPGQSFIADNGIGVLTPETAGEVCNEHFRTFIADLPQLRARALEYRAGAGRELSWERTARETASFLESL